MSNYKNNDNQGQLQRQLSPTHVWAIAFGCIIGWGSFINPGKKFLQNSGVAGTAIAMALGALVMIIIAFSYAYMVPKYPKAGGEFTFTKMCFGRNTAYVCGWFLVVAYLTNVPMNSTAIGLIVDGLDGTADILKWGLHYQVAGYDVWLGEMLLAIGILILFGILNILGVKKAGIVQTILAALLGISVVTLTIAALVSSKTSFANMAPWWGFHKSDAIVAWTNGTYTSIDEFANSGTVGAVALENWSDLIVESASTPWLLLTAAGCLLGTPGKILVGVAVSSAVLLGIMGFYLASSRLMYSMRRDGYLPEIFGVIDKKHGTPKNAMIFCIIISLSGPILGREALGWFVDMSAIGASIGYFFTCASALVTMKRDGDGTAFLKTMATIGVVFSIMFMVLQLIPIPGLSEVHFGKESYIMLLIWIVLGIAFYVKQMKK